LHCRHWWVTCDCTPEREFTVPVDYVTRKEAPARSCGCLRSEKLRARKLAEYDLTGLRFGDLIAVRVATDDEVPEGRMRNASNGRFYVVQCDCERGSMVVSGGALNSGSRFRCDQCVRDEASERAKEAHKKNGAFTRPGPAVVLAGLEDE